MENNEQTNPEVENMGSAEESNEESNDLSAENEALKKQLEERDTQISDLTGKLKRATKEKKEPREERQEAKTSEKSNDLDYGEKAYLRSALDLKGADELQLAKEFKGKYGMSVEELETDQVFLGKLHNLREARESQNAVPKGKGRSGETGNTEVDMAIAKYKETGELPSDFETRTKVVNKIAESETKGGMFSGPAVIG